TTSTIAPRRAPTASTSDTASSSSGIAASGFDPAATSVTVLRNARDSAATAPATSSRSVGVPPSAASMGVVSGTDLSPSLEGSSQGHLVGVLQVPADRQPGGQPGHPQPHRDQQPGEVRGGGLALDVGVRGEDDLGHLAVREPGHELGDPQVV